MVIILADETWPDVEGAGGPERKARDDYSRNESYLLLGQLTARGHTAGHM